MEDNSKLAEYSNLNHFSEKKIHPMDLGLLPSFLKQFENQDIELQSICFNDLINEFKEEDFRSLFSMSPDILKKLSTVGVFSSLFKKINTFNRKTKLILFEQLWMQLIDPILTTNSNDTMAAKTYIDGLFVSINNLSKFKEVLFDFYNVMNHLINELPGFTELLLESKHLSPDENASSGIKYIIHFNFSRSEQVQLLLDIWNKMQSIDLKLQFTEHFFNSKLRDNNAIFLTELIKNDPNFGAFLLSNDFLESPKIKTMMFAEKVSFIKQHLLLFSENNDRINKTMTEAKNKLRIELADLIIDHVIPYTLNSLGNNELEDNKTILVLLENIHAQIQFMPEKKKRLLISFGTFFEKKMQLSSQIAIRLLNGMGHDPKLCWFFLAYAFHIPNDHHINIYSELNFLVKLSSLINDVSRFSYYSILIEARYPEARRSLISIINRLPIKKSKTLALHPIEAPEKTEPHTFLSFLFPKPRLIRRDQTVFTLITGEMVKFSAEERQSYAQEMPQPFTLPKIAQEAEYEFIDDLAYH